MFPTNLPKCLNCFRQLNSCCVVVTRSFSQNFPLGSPASPKCNDLVVTYILGSLSDDDDDGSENGKKNKRFRLAKQQLCKCITFFCTFVCRHRTTTTWKCIISRFVGNVNTGQRLPFSFSELWYSPSEFNSRKICQHLTNWTRWNKRDKIWNRANWRRRFCLYSLLWEVVAYENWTTGAPSKKRSRH